MESRNEHKVLVVDDDWDVRALFSRVLTRVGFQVVFAQDGVSAVGAARKERPDAIVLDLGLPAGDGLRVLERLRALTQTAHVPVLVVTARQGEAEIEAREAGASDFLTKPVDPEKLISRLDCLIAA